MAVYVLRRGDPPETIVHRRTCARCRSVFTFTEADCADRKQLVIECPVCKIETDKSDDRVVR